MCIRDSYDLWSQWKPEEPEGILIVHASIHGNTAYASEALKSKLAGKGVRVTMCDLTVTDLSSAVTSAFYCGKLVLACSTYDGGLFPPMKEFLDVYKRQTLHWLRQVREALSRGLHRGESEGRGMKKAKHWYDYLWILSLIHI